MERDCAVHLRPIRRSEVERVLVSEHGIREGMRRVVVLDKDGFDTKRTACTWANGKVYFARLLVAR